MESPRVEQEPSPEEEELVLLRDMMLRARQEGEEPQVPDEELRSNDQLQQDEVLATFPNRSLLRLTACCCASNSDHGWSSLVITHRHRPWRIRSAPRVACLLSVWSWDTFESAVRSSSNFAVLLLSKACTSTPVHVHISNTNLAGSKH